MGANVSSVRKFRESALWAPQSVSDFVAEMDRVEHWRAVAGFPGYCVSSWGRVCGPRAVLAPSRTHGYLHVSLMQGGAAKTRRVHILVAEAFLGAAPFAGALVAHNDGDKENCRLINLRWASALENQADRGRHWTKVYGSRVFGAKLHESDIPIIRARIASGARYHAIAEEFGVSASTIALIKKGKIWKQAGGAAWPIARTQEQAKVA
jgi:hypothetical protein